MIYYDFFLNFAFQYENLPMKYSYWKLVINHY